MRVLIALVVIIYLVGVGVELAPTFQANWSTVPASQLAGAVGQALPGALTWPMSVYHRYVGAAPT
jgi:Flp pilus assembly pilin Flp